MSDEREWPDAVSDGLTLRCACCGRVPRFDYRIRDAEWEATVPEFYRRGVVCLPCLDCLATARGVDVSGAIEEVQFTGIGKTVVLRPVLVHRYQP